MQFHFLVGWLALVIQDDALEMETNRILSKHQQVNQGESTTLEACEQGYSPYFYFPQHCLQKTIKHKQFVSLYKIINLATVKKENRVQDYNLYLHLYSLRKEDCVDYGWVSTLAMVVKDDKEIYYTCK